MTSKDHWAPSHTRQDVEVVDSIMAFAGKYMQLMQFKLRFKKFDGALSPIISRHILQKMNAAAMLLFNPTEDYVVLIEQFRMGSYLANKSPWSLEPVTGLIEDNMSPRDTAIKEAKEEAGCEVLDILPVGSYLSSSGTTNEEMFLYCGRITECNTTMIYGLAEEHEDIKIHKIPTKEAFRMVANGKIFNAPAIILLQWLQINLDSVKQSLLTI